MKAINQKKALEMRILALREKKAMDFLTLEEQYSITIDNFKTIHLITNVMEKLMIPSGSKLVLMKLVIQVSANYLNKNFFDNTSKNPIRKSLKNLFIITQLLLKTPTRTAIF